MAKYINAKGVVVRWLGFVSFKSTHDFGQMLAVELGAMERGSMKEVCAEPLRDLRNESDLIRNSRHYGFGLLVRSEAIIREFPADVWSYRNERGQLIAHKKTKQSSPHHGEAFVLPRYEGIVIMPSRIAPVHRAAMMKAIWWAARRYRLPVYELRGSSLLFLKEVKE
jgi:hypothetical protein